MVRFSAPMALALVTVVAIAASAVAAIASTVTVPDDFPTIQAAVSAWPDTVQVRAGTYDEEVVLFRGVVVLGMTASDRPQVARVLIEPDDDAYSTFQYVVSLFTIAHGVRLKNNRAKFITLSVSDCELRGGVADSSINAESAAVNFVRCDIQGDVRVLVRGSLVLDSCHVVGHVMGGYSDAQLSVWHCELTGDGTGTGIASDSASNINQAQLYGNHMSGFERGIAIVAENTVYVRRNWIEGSAIHGVSIERSNLAYVDSNRVEACGDGILMDYVTNAYVLNNVILRSTGAGIRTTGERCATFVAEGNVVAMGSGNGMEILSQLGTGGVTNNTVVGNGGSGLIMRMTEDVKYGPFEVARNLATLNQGNGIEWLTGSSTVGGCNDWFDNTMGNTWGREAAQDDISVDPMFCDVDSADVRLNSASPLLNAAGCGQIGALGVGCGETPTLVQRFTASRVPDGVRVVWQVAAGGTASAIWVERGDGMNGQAWTRPAMERSTEGQAVIELDRTALPEQVYRYRLVAADGGKLVVLDPGVLVEAKARLSFALGQVGPSPSTGPLRIAFRLAHDAEIEIAVLDLVGRRVASLARGVWPAGAHEVAWGGGAPAGFYVVRYQYPGGTDRRTIVRVR